MSGCTHPCENCTCQPPLDDIEIKQGGEPFPGLSPDEIYDGLMGALEEEEHD